ncbi:hypothetical protein JOM56_005245 [Amanita muscaria]
MSKFVVALNDRLKVSDSIVGRWFLLEGCGLPNERQGSSVHGSRWVLLTSLLLRSIVFLHLRGAQQTEIRAGMTTWVAMAYIIAVNAFILSDAGGTCVCPGSDGCVNDTTYLTCVDEVKRDLITATAAISSVSSFLIGSACQSPSWFSSRFTYSVAGFHGTGMISYRQALAAVFMEGYDIVMDFPLPVSTGLLWLIRMPQSLVLAVCSGIGLFIAFVGLSRRPTHRSEEGILASRQYKLPVRMDKTGYASTSLAGYRSTTMWLGIFTGGMFTDFLMMYRIRGVILRDLPDRHYLFFKRVVTFRKLEKIGNALDYDYKYFLTSALQLITFRAERSFDILDIIGTLYFMARFAGLRDPVTLDFEISTIAYCVDAFCMSMGGPVTAFIESATGISEGGKTGLTAITTGIAFFVSIFFSPIFASIPSWATGGALVIVGSMMIRNVTEVTNWDYIGDVVSAFLTMIIIPLALLPCSLVFRTLSFTSNNSVACGIVAEIVSYVLLNGTVFLRKLSGGVIVPPNYDDTEVMGCTPW